MVSLIGQQRTHRLNLVDMYVCHVYECEFGARCTCQVDRSALLLIASCISQCDAQRGASVMYICALVSHPRGSVGWLGVYHLTNNLLCMCLHVEYSPKSQTVCCERDGD